MRGLAFAGPLCYCSGNLGLSMPELNLSHLVSFVIGVAGCDYGHKQNKRFFFDMNRAPIDVISAYRNSARTFNLDMTRLFQDYEQDVMPQAFIDRARVALKNNTDAIEILDYVEHECDGRVEVDGYMDLYLHIAQLSDPEMLWRPSMHYSIDLGGYGLFTD